LPQVCAKNRESDTACVFRFLEPTPPTYIAVPKERKREEKKTVGAPAKEKHRVRPPPYLPTELGLGKILARGFSGETSDQLPVASSFWRVWL